MTTGTSFVSAPLLPVRSARPFRLPAKNAASPPPRLSLEPTPTEERVPVKPVAPPRPPEQPATAAPAKQPARAAASEPRTPAARARALVANALDAAEVALFKAAGHDRLAANANHLFSAWAPQLGHTGVHRGLRVDGALPPELAGYFLQVGPNQQTLPPRARHHLFDGDGAIAVFALRPSASGAASLSWQWVETDKFLAERAGLNAHLTIASMRGKVGLAYIALFAARLAAGIARFDHNPANTSLFRHPSGALLALHESSMPYELRLDARDGALATVGPFHFPGAAYSGPVSAHPRPHPSNGCTYFVSYNVNPLRPPCVVQVVGADGALSRVVPVALPRRVMIHDAAVTERFVVVVDDSMYFSLPQMLLQNDRMPFRLDERKHVRFGLLPVDARDDADIQWITVDGPGFFVMHMVNAYDEGDKVILHTFVLRDFALEFDSVDDYGTSTLHCFELDTRTGTATKAEIALPGARIKSSWWKSHSTKYRERAQQLRDGASAEDVDAEEVDVMHLFDMPTVPDRLVGRKARFAYVLCAGFPRGARMPLPKSIVKVDLLAGEEVGRIELDDCVADENVDVGCGECQFVPRRDARSEDDGFLVTITGSQPRGNSALRVFDARTMRPEPVAVVHAPFRLPSAFHTLFIPADQVE